MKGIFLVFAMATMIAAPFRATANCSLSKGEVFGKEVTLVNCTSPVYSVECGSAACTSSTLQNACSLFSATEEHAVKNTAHRECKQNGHSLGAGYLVKSREVAAQASRDNGTNYAYCFSEIGGVCSQ